MKYIAGITLFNPDIKRLKDNILAIIDQIDELVLINNGSKNDKEINLLLNTINSDKIVLLNNRENIGVATALNLICEYAKAHSYEWAITLDQDSIVPENLVSEYDKSIKEEQVAMMTCDVRDVNHQQRQSEISLNDIEDVSLCITSASMIKISAWDAVGHFCDEMFIDCVDFDMCFSLTDAGYRIIMNNRVKLKHEIGHSKIVKFRGREELVFNHAPFRCYYIIRNSIYLGQRHNRVKYGWLSAIKRFVLINLFEENRIIKDKLMLKGFYHALIKRYGKLNS